MKKLISIFLVLFIFIPTFSLAENSLETYQLLVPLDGDSKVLNFKNGEDINTETLGTYINSWYIRAISIVTIFAVLILVFYGFQYSFSETIFKKGISRERIVLAVGGLILLLVAVILLETIDDDLTTIGSFDKITVIGSDTRLGLVDDSTRLERLEDIADDVCGAYINSTFNCIFTTYISSLLANNTSAACRDAISNMCIARDLLSDDREYKEEIRDYLANACQGKNAPCTLLKNPDGNLIVKENACNLDLDGGCRVNTGFYTKLKEASNKSAPITCTECGAPTVAHEHYCHSSATCGDIRTNDVDAEGKLDRFMALYSSKLYPVYEVKTDGEQKSFYDQLDALAESAGEGSEVARNVRFMKTKVIVVEKIGAEHFSVYNSTTDSNHSSSGLGSDGSNENWDLNHDPRIERIGI